MFTAGKEDIVVWKVGSRMGTIQLKTLKCSKFIYPHSGVKSVLQIYFETVSPCSLDCPETIEFYLPLPLQYWD